MPWIAALGAVAGPPTHRSLFALMAAALFVSAAWVGVAHAADAVDAAPAAPAHDSTAAVLAALQESALARLVRYERQREASGLVREAPVESSAVDASWWMRLERELESMPATTCREVPLIRGQSYPYAARIQALDRPERPRLEFDFRSACVRFERDGRVVGARNMKGHERMLVDHFRRVLPTSEFLQKWAQALEPQIAVTPVATAPEAEGDSPEDDEKAMRNPPRVDEPAEPVTKVNAPYPDIARDAGVEGTVIVMAKVGADGRVIRTRVTKGVPMLDDAAEKAVRQWRFKPAMLNGQPVATWVPVPVAFRLK